MSFKKIILINILILFMIFSNSFSNDKFLIRGVVEGFYGTPWSFEQRINLMPFFKKLNFNTFIYAPKDDPYHREKWQLPYPQKSMDNFFKLSVSAIKNDITLCLAISPGLSLKFSSKKDYQILLNKFLEFHKKTAISCFGLFFDDIPLELSHPEDKATFKNNAEAQIYFTNKIYLSLTKEVYDLKFLFCPTEYWGTEPTFYKKTIGEKLNKNIFIFWTGMDIIPEEIKTNDAKIFANLIKRKPLIWDNYPVNDFSPAYIFLDALRGREKDLYKETSGLLANPMFYPALSKIPLITIADYLNYPEKYNPENSLNKAIEKIAGKPAYSYLKTIVENLSDTKINNYKQPKLYYLSKTFLKDYYKTKDKNKTNSLNSFQNLKAEFINFQNAVINLNKIADKEFVKEIKSYTDKLKLYGEIGESILKILTNQQDKKFIQQEKIKLNQKINKASAMKVVICGKAMVSFIIKSKNIINYF